MKTLLKWTLAALLLSVGSTGWGQNIYNKFSPATGVLKGSATSYFTTAAASADIRGLWSGTCDATTFLRGDGSCATVITAVPGSNTQVIYNNSGAFGASSLMTFTSGSVVLNLGASTTPGTFSVGTLDSMVINGVTVPIPGFALNSNIQGVIENHSYVNGTAAGGARYYGVRSEGTISSPTIVANGDHLSTFYAAGYNGSTYSLGGDIIFQVNGTPGASAMPTDLLFQLSPTGSQTPATVMQLYHDAGVTIGSPTGGDQGSGTLNMAGCFVNGVACSTGGAAGANPTGLIGMTAVNGSAGTFTRSDSTHAIDPAISPTWSGQHTFGGNQTIFTGTGTGFNPQAWCDTGLTAGSRCFAMRIGGGGDLQIDVATDAFSPGTAGLDIGRSGAVVTAVNLGNATDNPAFSFLGTGATTFGGSTVANGGAVRANATSGNSSVRIQNSGTDKGIFCVSISAGSCTVGDSINDVTLDTQGGTLYLGANSGSSKQASIFNSGGVNVGAPTGGDKGSGTINTAGAIYVNNVTAVVGPAHAASCYVTVSGTTPTLVNTFGCSGVSRSATGHYTVTFSAGFTARPPCTVSAYGGDFIANTSDPSNSGTMDFLFDAITGGTRADPTGFMITCLGN